MIRVPGVPGAGAGPAAGAGAGGVCVVCGGGLGTRWHIDHFSEDVCPQCIDQPACLGCGAVTGGSGARAATVLADGRVRCRRCSAGAVDERADMSAVLPEVRSLLHSYGIRLPNRVRVELAELDDVRTPEHPHGAGYTVTARTGIGRPTVEELRVLRGLPATQFGALLSHEMGHAWLAGCPDIGRSERDEEGLCELVASWWLTHRGGRLAAHLLASMRQNPDPVYGEGFRRMARAAEGMTPVEIVARVSRRGRI